MYKYTEIEYTQNPPSFGGNWESGTEISVWFSTSPKKATSRQGVRVFRQEGVEGVPIMGRRILERDGKVIYDIWD